MVGQALIFIHGKVILIQILFIQILNQVLIHCVLAP